MNKRVRKDVMRKLVYGLYQVQHYDLEHGASIRQAYRYDTKRATHVISCGDFGVYCHSKYYDGEMRHCAAPAWVYYDNDSKMIYMYKDGKRV